MSLCGVDVPASIDSGYAIIRREFSVPSELRHTTGFIFDGSNFQIIAGAVSTYERFVISDEGELLLR
jgi:hypothetical protein